MKAEVKKRWTDALRSGTYEQGRGYLCVDNKYCCLGVLAEEEGLFTGEREGRKYAGGSGPGLAGLGACCMIVSSSLGFRQEQADDLAGMNDKENMSFPDIADWIDENIKVTE